MFSHCGFWVACDILIDRITILGKMRKRGCIVSKLLAKMMCNSGLTHVITMDLHQKEIQGFFDCPVDNLRASPFLLQYIQVNYFICLIEHSQTKLLFFN